MIVWGIGDGGEGGEGGGGQRREGGGGGLRMLVFIGFNYRVFLWRAMIPGGT